MNDIEKLLITVGIPAVISIIGFVVTIKTMKSNFQHEILKQKADVQLEKMAPIPYQLLELLQVMINGERNEIFEYGKSKNIQSELNYLLSTIFAYGSAEAIRIIALMQKENYENIGSKNRDLFRGMSLFVLAVVQIRYDITGKIVSPEYWFQMKITDYSDNTDRIKKANNDLVKELELDPRFLII